jgi:hypothetical protein
MKPYTLGNLSLKVKHMQRKNVIKHSSSEISISHMDRRFER